MPLAMANAFEPGLTSVAPQCPIGAGTLVPLARPEACCGFGGAFSLDYPEIAQAITEDKVDDIAASGAEAVICAEPSCLQNIASVMAKRGLPIRALHLAEVLAGGEA